MKKFFKETRRKLKGLNKTISYVHKKTTYLYTFIFLDILWCYIVYGTTYNEYRIFEFYKIDASIRKTYMSRRKFKKVNRKLVDHEILNVVNDKEYTCDDGYSLTNNKCVKTIDAIEKTN